MTNTHRPLLLLSLAALALGGACGPLDLEDDDEHAYDDLVSGQNASSTMQGLAKAGRWTLPADVARAGNQQDVAYDSAPPFNGGSNCSGGATDGALGLRDHMLGYFPQIRFVGIYNCRVIAGTNAMSLHGVGRALDIMLPTAGGGADNTLGDPIANWLVENAEAIGVQAVIWDRTIWSVTGSPRAREYTGSNPHVDHIHVELNIPASRENTRWFDNPFGPDACETLPAIRPGDPVVVGDKHDCFRMFGPADRWHRDNDAGLGGSLLWTRAKEGPRKTNWARWRLPLRAAGRYQVQVFIDPDVAEFAHARYKVHTKSGTHVVEIDQGAADGWTTLGEFRFAADGEESVVLVDRVDGALEGAERVIVADGLRVRVPPAD